MNTVNTHDIVTVRVTFYGAIAPDDNSDTFTRYFPDMETWERIQSTLKWTYSKIEVTSVYGYVDSNKKFVSLQKEG